MFNFDCTCCGDCCSGDMNIFLNVYDLYKMAKHLKFKNTKELFDKNYLILDMAQNGIKLPKIKFKTKPYPFCPFLINDMDEEFNLKGFCSLHPYIKPLVCILAPVSKDYTTESDETKYYFTKPTENCPGVESDKTVTVDDSIKPVLKEITYEKSFYRYLDYIIDNKVKNYEELYYFDVADDFKLLNI